MYVLEFTKKIINVLKLDTELRILNSKYDSLTIKDDYLQLMFESSLSQEEVDAISNKINTFVETDIVEELKTYIETKVKPFIDNLMYQIKAENIIMGITQLGKTVDVLGFFNTKVIPENKTRGVSLREAMADDSLYAVIEILDYWIARPELYTDLSPFVTADRLTDLKARVVAFLE